MTRNVRKEEGEKIDRRRGDKEAKVGGRTRVKKSWSWRKRGMTNGRKDATGRKTRRR